MNGKLILKDRTVFNGVSVGHDASVAGEVVFTTGMVGYPESLTDPSYQGQILIFTYPLIGNYGVPDKSLWESSKIHTLGIIVSSLTKDTTHHQSKRSLKDWLIDEKIPALEISDTRLLTQKLRDAGSMLGKIIIDKKVDWYDPNAENLSLYVSTKSPYKVVSKSSKRKSKHIVIIDCGVKQNIIRSLNDRGVDVTVVPWNFDVMDMNEKIDGVVISNGPGDPKLLTKTIQNVRELLQNNIPMLGICLGNQLLALAGGGDTYKLKFGHRSQNQPCELCDSSHHYFLTTQNHGFSVGKIPTGFVEWFRNANDGTNEGIIHKTKPFMSVQFHPEAYPGPMDTGWVFDYFLSHLQEK